MNKSRSRWSSWSIGRALRPRTLRQRLIGLVTAVLLITLVLFGMIAAYLVYRSEEAAWRGRQGEAARNAAQTVAAFVSRTEGILILADQLGRDELLEDPRELEKLVAQNPALQEVVYLDRRGRVLVTAHQDRAVLANLFTIPQSQWFLTARNGQRYHGGLQIAFDDQPYVIIAIPASEEGAIAARLRMDVLWDVVADIRFGQSGYAYVIDGSGHIIAHTDPQVVLSYTSIADRPEYQQWLAAPNREWFGAYRLPDGQAVVGATAAVAGTDWLMITELPQAEAYSTSRTALLLLSVEALLLSVIVIRTSSHLLENAVLRPMDRLREGARRIGQGDLEARIGLQRDDEIGQVAQAFDTMAIHLSQQRTALERYAQQLEALYQVSLSVASNLQLDTVLDIVLGSTFKLLPGISNAHIFLYENDALTFVASLWADGREDELAATPRPQGMTYTVARTGEPIIVPNAATSPLFADIPTLWCGALAGIPLKIGARVVGVMNVAYAQPHVFPDYELRTLRLLGDQVAIAIENARLYGALQQELVERQQAERALRESEARYRAIVEDQTELICRWRPDGTLSFVNEAYCRYFGKTREELVGYSFLPLIPEEDQAHVAAQIARLSLNNPVQSYEHRVILADGQVRWQQWTDRAIFGDEGEIIEYASVGRDVTERKLAEEALRKLNEELEERVRQRTAELTRLNYELRASEERFRQLAENIDDVFWLIDLPAAHVVYISPAFERLSGYSREAIYANPLVWLEYVFPADREQASAAIDHLFNGVHQLNETYRFVRRDGAVRWVRWRTFAIRNEQGEVYRIAGITEDITERVHAEEQIKSSLREKEVMLKEIHHRVKNNLQVISSLLNLQSSYLEDEKARSLFRDSQNRIRSMALIHEKLYQSKDLARVNFADYLRSLATSLFSSYRVSSTSIQLDIQAEDVFLGIDTAIPCGLIVNELVSNALKYAFPDGRSGAIRIILQPATDDHYLLAVADDGVGFPKHIDFRNTSSLGMQLVNTLTDQLDGTVELYADAGTRFEVVFPRPK